MLKLAYSVFLVVCLDGRSLVQYTEELGMLSERMNIIHAVWVNNIGTDIIAEYGAFAYQSSSNLRLGSGIMPLRQMLDRIFQYVLVLTKR